MIYGSSSEVYGKIMHASADRTNAYDDGGCGKRIALYGDKGGSASEPVCDRGPKEGRIRVNGRSYQDSIVALERRILSRLLRIAELTE